MSSPSPTSATGSPSQPQTIDLNTLPTQQLNSVKNQLTQELQHLTTSFTQLKQAQAKFRDCIASVRDGLKTEGTPLLIPLTPSLYVPGTLASTSTVLIDIGTGFYVEKDTKEAQEFYKRKVEELGRNLGDLEKIVRGKEGNLGVVEDVLRQKVIAESSKGGEAGEGST